MLLQVAMHAEIAQEQMEFTPVDICSGICEKLIRRHPHVFGSITVSGTGEVLKNWEEIKKNGKRAYTGRFSVKIGDGCLP